MALLGIDIGTQSLKAVVTADDLTVKGQGQVAYPVDHPRPGWAQQDPVHWEEALAPAVAAALAQAGLAPGAIRAMGVAGQLDGCVAVGADGRALGPCLIWMDRRAAGVMPAELPADFRSVTGLVADPGHMAAKIAWLSKNAVGLGGARFHQPVSYLVERLTGAFVFDHGLASTTMLYDLAARELSPALLELFGIARGALPALAGAAEIAGRLTDAGAALAGLVAGVPVAVGTGDDFATPLGAGIVAPGTIACVLGTAEVVGGLSDRAVIDPDGLVETHGYATSGYLVENPGWLAGGAVAWLRGILGAADDAELDRLAQAVPAGAGGVTFLPALSGAMAPAWAPGARGCFYGLTPAHGRGHLARALLEGCAFAMRDVIDRLEALAVPADRVVLLGGGAQSQVWAQIRADVLGRAVEVSDVVDACPLGAAALAAVAGGVYRDATAAAAAIPVSCRAVAPERADRAAADAGYRRYRALFEALGPLF